MPDSPGPLTAVLVSGGRQLRVAAGDRVLVDRLAADPGGEVVLDKVLLLADGDSVKATAPDLEGQVVTARVLGHRRGPKIDVLRYKAKKRVRVRRGARAELTALEILTVGKGGSAPDRSKVTAGAKAPSRAKAASKPKGPEGRTGSEAAEATEETS